MKLADETPATMIRMPTFRHIIGEAEMRNELPVLQKYLPEVSGGILPDEYSIESLFALK